MTHYSINSSTGGICDELARNYPDTLRELVKEQDNHSAEAWTIGVDYGNGFEFSTIETGEKSKIDDLDMFATTDAFYDDSVERIISIHTHPTGDFLSPSDVESHTRFNEEYNEHESTVIIKPEGDGFATLFSATNKDRLSHFSNKNVKSIVEQYENKLEGEGDISEFYKTVSNMFDHLEKHIDFCKQRVDLQW